MITTLDEFGTTMPSRGADAWVGLRVGPYVIASRIGRGGMGTVWRAVHEELGSAVAIKV